MALITEASESIPTSAACAALGVSRATLYRARRPRPRHRVRGFVRRAHAD